MDEPSDNFLDLSNFEKQQKIKSNLLIDIQIVKEKNTNNLYLAKISHDNVTKDTPAFNLSILHESNILSKISHPSIIKFIGFSPKDFQDNKKHVMITEYCSKGSLKQQQFNEITDTQKLIILFGIASGMRYLHSNKIIFRNLNLDNILLDDKLYPKICGFQLADIYTNSPYLSSIEGKPMYIAPEILEKGKYSEASDVYAFGIIAYQLLTGHIPFQKLNTNEIYEYVKNNQRPDIDSFDIPKPYKKLIQTCCSQDQNQRPSFEQIVNQLKTDNIFKDKKEFLQYVHYIEHSKIEFNADKLVIETPQKTTNQIITNKSNKFFRSDLQSLKYFAIKEAKQELAEIDAQYCYFQTLDFNFDLNKLKNNICKMFLDISKENKNGNSTIKMLEYINKSIEDEYNNKCNRKHNLYIATISSRILEKIINILANSIDLDKIEGSNKDQKEKDNDNSVDKEDNNNDNSNNNNNNNDVNNNNDNNNNNNDNNNNNNDNYEKTCSKGECKNNTSMETNQKKKRKAFTKEEDELIKDLVMKYGTKQWNLIAEFVKDRTPKQIKDRYFNYLSQGFFSDKWSKEEDELLKELYKKHGPKWTVLQKSFKNRSANTIKNRWDFSLCRQINMKNCNETAAISTINNEKLSNHINKKYDGEKEDKSIKTNTDDSAVSEIDDYLKVFDENSGEESFEFFNFYKNK